MKGCLALLMTGLLPIVGGIAQESPATPQNNMQNLFVLELDDKLINDLKARPEGLIARVPAELRGKIDGVKLVYKPPQLPVGPQLPAGFNTPDNAKIPNLGSSSTENPAGFGGLSSLAPNRNSQSTIHSKNDNSSQNSKDSLQQTASSQFPANDPRAAWPDRRTPGQSAPKSDNGFVPVTQGTRNQPTSVWDPIAKKRPNSLSLDDDLLSQAEILRRQADELEARRLAAEEQNTQRAKIDEYVKQQMRLEREKMMRELRESQYANRENEALHGNPRYAAQPNDMYSLPTRQVDHRSVPYGDDYELASDRLGGYGQRILNERDRTITRVAMAPRPSDAASSPELIVDSTKPTMPTSTNTPSSEKTDTQRDAGEKQLAANQKTEVALLIMLLSSIALNIYLGWIARGFYVRYNDLADELRETFSATA